MDPNSTSTAPELLPGQSPPLSVITPTDQSGIVLIGTALALIFALLSMLIRGFVRLQFRHEFARDDVVAVCAMIFAVVQSSVVFVEISKGLGKTIEDVDPTDLIQFQKELYASDILYLITLWLTKCSIACLFVRLSPNKQHAVMSNVILAATTVLMVASVLTIALRCDLSHPWIFINTQCTNLFLRWQVITAFDVITEVALFATSTYLLFGLQMSLEKKFVVILAFGLRLPVIAAAGIRLYYLAFEISSSDPTLDSMIVSICTQIHISYAIISATTPCLRPFMSALSTNYGAPAPMKPSPAATQTGRSDNEYSLAAFSRISGIEQADDRRENGTAPTNRWDKTEHHTAVAAGDQNSMDSHESKQMIISKNTEWGVAYQGRDRNP